MSGPVRPPLKTQLDNDTSENRPVNTLSFANTDFALTNVGTKTTVALTGGAGGTIGGSIADTQVAFGSGADTIEGEAAFTYDKTINQLKLTGFGDNVSEFLIERSAGSSQTIGIENDSSSNPKILVKSGYGSNTKLMEFRNSITHTAVTGGTSGFIFYAETDGAAVAPTTQEFMRMTTSDSVNFEVVFNEDSKDQDFRVESDAYSQMFLIDAGLNKAHFGTGGIDNALGLVQISVGNSIQNALTLISTDSDALSAPAMEFYRNSSSIEAGNQLGIIAFSGNNTSGDKETYGSINVQIDSGAVADSTSMQFKVKRSGVEVDNFRIRYSEVVVNEDSVDCDFRVEVNDNIYGLHVDANLETVGINTIGQADSDLTIMPSIHRSAAQTTSILQLRNNNVSLPSNTKYATIEFYNVDSSGPGVGASIDVKSNGSGRGGWFQFRTGTNGGASTVKMGLNENGILTVGSNAASTGLADNNPLLQVQGSISGKMPVIIQNSDATLTRDGLSGQTYVCTDGGTTALTMPLGALQGDYFYFVSSSGGIQIVVDVGTQLLNGGTAAITRSTNNEVYTVLCIEDNKFILNNPA